MNWQDISAITEFDFTSGRITHLAPQSDNADCAQGFYTVLGDMAVFSASGDDAASFLHGQLSNDVERLPQGPVRRAAYCTAKGRMITSFSYWKNSDTIYLQCDANQQPAVQKRLQMFVLRSKVKLASLAENLIPLGLGGAKAEALLTTYFAALPAIGEHVHDAANGMLLRHEDAGAVARYQWLVPAEQFAAVWQALKNTLVLSNSSDWYLGDILSGVSRVVAATQEVFVPQMINFELTGGVNFRKGCYPGQEIVARSQYLGKLKRRSFLASVAETGLNAGQELFNPASPEQPCGHIVNVELLNAGESLLLAEMTMADAEQGDIRVGAADGPALQFRELPYVIHDITRTPE